MVGIENLKCLFMPSGQWQCQLENSLNFGKIFGFHLDKSLLYFGIKLNKKKITCISS